MLPPIGGMPPMLPPIGMGGGIGAPLIASPEPPIAAMPIGLGLAGAGAGGALRLSEFSSRASIADLGGAGVGAEPKSPKASSPPKARGWAAGGTAAPKMSPPPPMGAAGAPKMSPPPPIGAAGAPKMSASPGAAGGAPKALGTAGSAGVGRAPSDTPLPLRAFFSLSSRSRPLIEILPMLPDS